MEITTNSLLQCGIERFQHRLIEMADKIDKFHDLVGLENFLRVIRLIANKFVEDTDYSVVLIDYLKFLALLKEQCKQIEFVDKYNCSFCEITSIFGTILNADLKNQHNCVQKLMHLWIRCLKRVSTGEKYIALTVNLDTFSKLAQLMIDIADYGLQTMILEIFIRYCGNSFNSNTIAVLIDIFLSVGFEIKRFLLHFQFKQFPQETRKILNALNAANKHPVLSMIAKEITLNGTKVEPYANTGLWVDFNRGSRTCAFSYDPSSYNKNNETGIAEALIQIEDVLYAQAKWYNDNKDVKLDFSVRELNVRQRTQSSQIDVTTIQIVILHSEQKMNDFLQIIHDWYGSTLIVDETHMSNSSMDDKSDGWPEYDRQIMPYTQTLPKRSSEWEQKLPKVLADASSVYESNAEAVENIVASLSPESVVNDCEIIHSPLSPGSVINDVQVIQVEAEVHFKPNQHGSPGHHKELNKSPVVRRPQAQNPAQCDRIMTYDEYISSINNPTQILRVETSTPEPHDEEPIQNDIPVSTATSVKEDEKVEAKKVSVKSTVTPSKEPKKPRTNPRRKSQNKLSKSDVKFDFNSKPKAATESKSGRGRGRSSKRESKESIEVNVSKTLWITDTKSSSSKKRRLTDVQEYNLDQPTCHESIVPDHRSVSDAPLNDTVDEVIVLEQPAPVILGKMEQNMEAINAKCRSKRKSENATKPDEFDFIRSGISFDHGEPNKNASYSYRKFFKTTTTKETTKTVTKNTRVSIKKKDKNNNNDENAMDVCDILDLELVDAAKEVPKKSRPTSFEGKHTVKNVQQANNKQAATADHDIKKEKCLARLKTNIAEMQRSLDQMSDNVNDLNN